MIKIRETKDKKLIRKLAEEYKADNGLDPIINSWVASENNLDVGLMGVFKWDKDYVIVDMFAAKECPKKDEIMGKLVDYLIEKAKKEKITKIYCHMGDNKIDYFLNKGFVLIKESELPLGYFCSCTQCPNYKVTCFPRPSLLKI